MAITLNGTTGIVTPDVNSTGGLTVDNDGATVATFDRATSDGTIAEFQKDGTTVGSISSGGTGVVDLNGTSASTLSIGGTAQCVVQDGTFRPAADNDVDLGTISGNTRRFKNLYLSGGVYLGGTGAANYLDDYEEGTWTPTLAGGFSSGPQSYDDQAGTYVKIGKYVYFQFKVNASGVVANTSGIYFGGLPFTSVNGSESHGGAFVNYQIAFNGNAGDTYHVNGGATRVSVYDNGGSARQGSASNVNLNNLIVLTGCYLTNA